MNPFSRLFPSRWRRPDCGRDTDLLDLLESRLHQVTCYRDRATGSGQFLVEITGPDGRIRLGDAPTLRGAIEQAVSRAGWAGVLAPAQEAVP